MEVDGKRAIQFCFTQCCRTAVHFKKQVVDNPTENKELTEFSTVVTFICMAFEKDPCEVLNEIEFWEGIDK